MAEKRKFFSPCSERDVRAAALKATHERLKMMDEKKQPTVGKFGEVLREEMASIRSYGEKMAKQGTCRVMTWDELKKAKEDFAKRKKISPEG